MPALPPQPVPIRCPNCGTNFQTPVFQLVDVGQQPELKQALLSGRLNVAVCPKCGAGGLLATPLVYHDPDKQLFLSLFPQEIAAKELGFSQPQATALQQIAHDELAAYRGR